MSDGWPNVGRAIRDAREVKQMSLAELGKQIGVGQSQVSRIETFGKLALGRLRRIARVLDTKTDVLVRYAEALDQMHQEYGLEQKRQEIAALEQQAKKRAGRLSKTGKR